MEKTMKYKSLILKSIPPFEDMTEYALDKDLDGMKKGYKNIERCFKRLG